jgi:lipoate-protein ligase B
MDLHPFGLINPCGVERMPVTSMRKMLSRVLPGEQVRETIKDVMGNVFGFDFREITLNNALNMLKNPPPAGTAESFSYKSKQPRN